MKLQQLKEEIAKAQRLRDDESLDKEYGDSHTYRWDQYKETRDTLVSQVLIDMSTGEPWSAGELRQWSDVLLTLYTR